MAQIINLLREPPQEAHPSRAVHLPEIRAHVQRCRVRMRLLEAQRRRPRVDRLGPERVVPMPKVLDQIKKYDLILYIPIVLNII